MALDAIRCSEIVISYGGRHRALVMNDLRLTGTSASVKHRALSVPRLLQMPSVCPLERSHKQKNHHVANDAIIRALNKWRHDRPSFRKPEELLSEFGDSEVPSPQSTNPVPFKTTSHVILA